MNQILLLDFGLSNRRDGGTIYQGGECLLGLWGKEWSFRENQKFSFGLIKFAFVTSRTQALQPGMVVLLRCHTIHPFKMYLLSTYAQSSVLDDVDTALIKPDTTGVFLLAMPDFRTSNSSGALLCAGHCVEYWMNQTHFHLTKYFQLNWIIWAGDK